MTTRYHAATWATALTLNEAPDSASGLSRAIGNARVDLNPHQVDAALFALRSPLATGAILADEVGLGKTIEAALLIKAVLTENPGARVLYLAPARLVRNVRRDGIKHVETKGKDAKMPEDLIKKTVEKVGDMLKEAEAKIEKNLREKTEEIMTI